MRSEGFISRMCTPRDSINYNPNKPDKHRTSLVYLGAFGGGRQRPQAGECGGRCGQLDNTTFGPLALWLWLSPTTCSRHLNTTTVTSYGTVYLNGGEDRWPTIRVPHATHWNRQFAVHFTMDRPVRIEVTRCIMHWRSHLVSSICISHHWDVKLTLWICTAYDIRVYVRIAIIQTASPSTKLIHNATKCTMVC